MRLDVQENFPLLFTEEGGGLLDADTHLLPQLLQELRDPTLTFRLLGSPRYGLGEGDRGSERGASVLERAS